MYDDGEIVERWGFRFKISIDTDHDMAPPWKEHDCHGDVREVRAVHNRPSKRPGERILYEHRDNYWLYDWQGAIRKAKKEGWGLWKKEALTKGQIRALAVQQDFDRLRGWLNDEWTWTGVGVECVETEQAGYCGGFASDDEEGINQYVDDQIAELLPLTRFERKVREAAEKPDRLRLGDPDPLMRCAYCGQPREVHTTEQLLRATQTTSSASPRCSTRRRNLWTTP
jgi:hypothetical protein